MYITNYTKHKCSECGAIDRTETISRKMPYGYKKILRCTTCGHEKVISTIKNIEFQKPAVYELQRKEFEEF